MPSTGGGGKKAAYEVTSVQGVSLATQRISGIDKDGLRTVTDQIRTQINTPRLLQFALKLLF